MSRFDLVIFDCDGVLIDSERLAVRTESQILTELGWPLTEAEVIERFVGRSAVYMQAVIEQTIGRPVDWQVEFERRVREVFERELVPVDGIIATGESMDEAIENMREAIPFHLDGMRLGRNAFLDPMPIVKTILVTS